MKLAIITGGSKGLGHSLVDTFCENGFQVISIARKKSAFEHKNLLKAIEFDLTHLNEFDSLYTEITTCLIGKKMDSLIWINNAGRLGKIAKTENCSAADLSKTIQLNLTVPLVLSSWVIRHFGNTFPLQILNISSGAAFNSYSGWTAYCASKAGLESMTKNIALEQEGNPNFRILSISPGVIDTEMQQQIRTTSTDDFPLVERFIAFHKENQLSKPEDLAKKLFFVCESDRFTSGVTVILKDL